MAESARKVLTDPLINNNPISLQILGICSALAVTSNLVTALIMCLALTAVTAFSNLSISMIRNQIFLPAGDLTDEEILTRQRELATNFRYFTWFGLSYRFGSIFSDIVNPRFEGL